MLYLNTEIKIMTIEKAGSEVGEKTFAIKRDTTKRGNHF